MKATLSIFKDLPQDIQKYIINDFVTPKDVINSYTTLVSDPQTDIVVNKHIKKTTNKTYEELQNICLHDNCLKMQQGHGYCNDHLFLHQCVRCFVIYESDNDLYIDNTYSVYNYITCTGYNVRQCNNCYCDKIKCNRCMNINVAYAISKNYEYICESCYYNIKDEYNNNFSEFEEKDDPSNYTVLDFEMDFSFRKYIGRSIDNVIQTGIYEFAVEKKYENNTYENGYRFGNPDYVYNYLIIRVKPKEYLEEDEYIRFDH